MKLRHCKHIKTADDKMDKAVLIVRIVPAARLLNTENPLSETDVTRYLCAECSAQMVLTLELFDAEL